MTDLVNDREQMRASHLWPIAFLCLIGFSGCTIVTKEMGDPLPQTSQTVIGATTQDVLDAFGPPNKVSSLNEGYAFLYEHNVVHEKQLGISSNYGWLHFFKFAIGSAEVDREALILTFDRDGRLFGSTSREWTEDYGGGKSLQFIFTVMSLVETGEIAGIPASLTWGGAMLNPNLIQSLNRPHSPQYGIDSMELSGTPTGVGQHSLEANSFPDSETNNF